MSGDKRPDSDRSMADRLRRRHVIQMSAGVTAGLAGCNVFEGGDAGGPAGGDDTGTGASNTGDGSGGTNTIASAFTGWAPSKTNMNTYSAEGNVPPWLNYLWFEGTLYRDNRGRTIHFTIEEVEFNENGEEVLFRFDDDYVWWDGSPVTAEDYLIQRRIEQYQTYTSPEQSPVTLELVDDYTVRERRDTPINPKVRKLNQIGALITKRDIYREWLERYEDAGGEDAVDSVSEDLEQYQIGFEEAVEDGFGMGLFKPTQWNPNRVTLEKFEDHPRADWTNLEEWTWELVEGDQKFDQAFYDDRFDMGELNFNLVEEHDQVENIEEMRVPGVPKLSINFDNKHLGRRAVRRAIAYLVDRDEVRRVLKANFGTPYLDHPEISGMSRPVGEEYIGADHLEQFVNYGSASRPEDAETELRSAGYTKEGGLWVDDDGDAIDGLKYITPPWGIYEQITQYLAPKLTEFGIGTEAVLPSRSNFYQRLNENYEFDLVTWYHSGLHPTTSYNTGTQFGPTGLDNYEEVAESVEDIEEVPELTHDTSPRMKHPIRPEFPTEVGRADASSDTETLYPIMWNNVMSGTQDEARVEELSKKLSWYYNWQVPHIGLYEEVWNYWGRTDKYSFRGNHPETESTEREHYIVNEDAFQVALGHVSSKGE
jgi:ABC-type transport system substrate-binding protein